MIEKATSFSVSEDLVFWANVNSSTIMLFSYKKWSFRALFDLGDVCENKYKISHSGQFSGFKFPMQLL